MRRQAPLSPLAALAVASALHGFVFAVLSVDPWTDRRTEVASPALDDAAAAQDPTVEAVIELVDWEPRIEPTVPGPADALGEAGTHPLPGAEADLPGSRAASRGGGTGGATAFTGRRDDDDRRAQLWSDPLRYLLPRRDTGRTRESPEALARVPEPGFDDRTARGRPGATGQPAPSPSSRGAAAASELPIARPEAGDAPALEPSPQRRRGRLRARRATALTERGAHATDAARRGPAYSDDADSIAASDESQPSPFDLTVPRAGRRGEGEGVRGTGRALGLSAYGVRLGEGSAALRADLPRGALDASTRARRTNPYFRSMYEEIDRLVTYPRTLALSLEQGEVIARFTLSADGEVVDLALEKSSGYASLDDQVLRAIATAAPYGPVPLAIIGTRASIVVRAPYAFRNPWIR